MDQSTQDTASTEQERAWQREFEASALYSVAPGARDYDDINQARLEGWLGGRRHGLALSPVIDADFGARSLHSLAAQHGALFSSHPTERYRRFLEDAVQVSVDCGCSPGDARLLVERVLHVHRPRQPALSAGAAAVGLAALCQVHGLTLAACAWAALASLEAQATGATEGCAAAPAPRADNDRDDELVMLRRQVASLRTGALTAEARAEAAESALAQLRDRVAAFADASEAELVALRAHLSAVDAVRLSSAARKEPDPH